MKSFTIEATTTGLTQVLKFIDYELESLNCEIKVQYQIDVAVEEIYVNIVSYAYNGNKGNVTIEISSEVNPKSVTISFTDSGIPYNPLEKEDPDITLSAEERSIGGLGIYMVKKSMDYVSYDYKDEKNIFSIKKYL